MQTRELNSPPWILPLYLRTAVPLIPGASWLPGIPGGGGALPELELTLAPAPFDRQKLVAYGHLCGYAPEADTVPVTFPHLLAFPLHMALMTDGCFPFGAVGLVHLGNQVTQHRRLRADEEVGLSVRASDLKTHARGRTFDLVTVGRVGAEVIWEERATMLVRGHSGASRPSASRRTEQSQPAAAEIASFTFDQEGARRYASISADRNPIHMHALGAKIFGFPRAIAHGMWLKARCVAALAPQLPDSYTVAVQFRKPVLLPSTVTLSSTRQGRGLRFIARGSAEELHLQGRVTGGTRASALS